MSYLNRLKALSNPAAVPSISQKPPPQALTELTKAPSVSFVSSPGDTFSENQSQPPEDKKQDDLTERAGMLMDNGIPQEQADGLALALHLLQSHPQAEAALCWLIDNRN